MPARGDNYIWTGCDPFLPESIAVGRGILSCEGTVYARRSQHRHRLARCPPQAGSGFPAQVPSYLQNPSSRWLDHHCAHSHCCWHPRMRARKKASVGRARTQQADIVFSFRFSPGPGGRGYYIPKMPTSIQGSDLGTEERAESAPSAQRCPSLV